ncbi:MAG: ROK family protein [Micrococcales bacterium]|nr:ROK family protein [Micrococcales bacterium]
MNATLTASPSAGIALGVDIGGSGVKGAPVDLATGEFAAERCRVATPQPSVPEALIGAVAEVIEHFDLPEGTPIGVAYPGVVIDGIMMSAANLDKGLIGLSLPALVEERVGRPVFGANDADAAGFAEIAFGSAKGVPGTVLVTTLGTGIGSALINNGFLIPNTELGHLEIDGLDAEVRASGAARDREGLSFREWAPRLQRYFEVVDFLLHPDLIVVGGGVSRKHEKFLPLLQLRPPIIPAALRNTAGIVGAAALAAQAFG